MTSGHVGSNCPKFIFLILNNLPILGFLEVTWAKLLSFTSSVPRLYEINSIDPFLVYYPFTVHSLPRNKNLFLLRCQLSTTALKRTEEAADNHRRTRGNSRFVFNFSFSFFF
ncbi:unnamed protein product [Coffea canephora]|uniref:Uncharacterized protein n=1 Tax=Coffea canephora TaxID=49390 RepID=A0A068UQX0_COFCA|nr:unnamed protein product [Coffea canephora]